MAFKLKTCNFPVDLISRVLSSKWFLSYIILFKYLYFVSSTAPDIRSVVYNYGAQEMVRQDEWDAMWQRYEESEVASEKLRLLYGMAQTREVWLLSRYVCRYAQPAFCGFENLSS